MWDKFFINSIKIRKGSFNFHLISNLHLIDVRNLEMKISQTLKLPKTILL